MEISSGITTIAGWTFDSCTSLTSVVIPKTVKIISESAFYGCSSLTSVVIPQNITAIGEDAFSACSNLTSIYYAGTKNKWTSLVSGLSDAMFDSVTVYYYSETQPTTSGNYWYYGEDGNPVVWE